MKNLILKILYRTAYYSGVFELFFFLNRKRQAVITYHNVIPDELFDESLVHLGVSCKRSVFSTQLDIILSRFSVTTDVGHSGTCIISFDDGYKNNIEVAAPILNEKNIAGLFFIPACFFAGENILWVDKLLMWVSYIPVGQYSVLGKNVAVHSSVDRQELWSNLYQKLLLDYSDLDSITQALEHSFSFDQLEQYIDTEMYSLRFNGMTAAELDKMKILGHKLGCHSFRHDILSLLDEEALEEDFEECASYAKNYNTRLYSYPFGGESEVSSSVINTCKKHGYDAAFLNYQPKQEGCFTIGRISLGNLTDKYAIEARLCGFENFLKWVLKS